ncbi:MAG: hypothetical protein WCC53_03945 [Thermoanaerobaculia bacterium]
MLWALLPHAVFVFLWAVTFRRWVLPFEDSGREMHTAWRLAAGETLYRDVGYSYGPLAPLLDASLLRLFGKSVDVLVAWRTAVGLLGVEMLRRLAGRHAADHASTAAVTAFAVAACAFGVGGSWPFPYSAAALLGMVLVWAGAARSLSSEGPRASAVAGLLAGLASACKLEVVPGALGALLFGLLARRPRREVAGAVALAGSVAGLAYGLPVARFGVAVVRRQGFLIALDLPESWRRVYERSVLFGGLSRADFLRGGFLEVVFPSAVFLGALFLLLRTRVARSRAMAPLLFVLAAGSGLAWPRNEALHALLLVALGVAVAALVSGLVRLWRSDRSACEGAAVASAVLPAVLRQPFFLRNPVYGAFSAPLALALALAWVSRRVVARRAFLAAVLGLCAAQAAQRVQGIGRAPMVFTRLPGLSAFFLPEESRFLSEAAATIERIVPPGGAVGIFPEPGTLLFVTNRRNPFVDELFLPGVQDAAAEDEMIRRLKANPPAAILVTNRRFPEFGEADYGKGLLDRFFAEVSARYVVAGRIGGGPAMLRHASEALVFVPRPPAIPSR